MPRKPKAVVPITEFDPSKTEWTKAERWSLIERARHGDTTALPELRAMLKAHPQTVRYLTDFVGDARRWTVEQWSGGNLLYPEVFPMGAHLMAEDLAGPDAPPLEMLLCQRVATCHLALHVMESSKTGYANGQPFNNADEEHLEMLKNRAHRRYLDAILALAKVRRLLVPAIGQVNIAEAGAQQLNAALSQATLPPGRE